MVPRFLETKPPEYRGFLISTGLSKPLYLRISFNKLTRFPKGREI
nr:MAG TPA: hypothetical protein [Caudoviricetes sp.]